MPLLLPLTLNLNALIWLCLHCLSPPPPPPPPTECQPSSPGLAWFCRENICRPLLWTVVSRSPGWYTPEPGFEPTLAPGKPAACLLQQQLRGCSGRGSFLLLSSCSVLWAAVVGKCRVINNSYINAKAAGGKCQEEMVFQISTHFIIPPILDYFLQQSFLNSSYGGMLNGEKLIFMWTFGSDIHMM